MPPEPGTTRLDRQNLAPNGLDRDGAPERRVHVRMQVGRASGVLDFAVRVTRERHITYARQRDAMNTRICRVQSAGSPGRSLPRSYRVDHRSRCSSCTVMSASARMPRRGFLGDVAAGMNRHGGAAPVRMTHDVVAPGDLGDLETGSL